jgi:hypothetical protein
MKKVLFVFVVGLSAFAVAHSGGTVFSKSDLDNIFITLSIVDKNFKGK